jgi:radical SAM protein with 4Fe4S-binding SPASM domain
VSAQSAKIEHPLLHEIMAKCARLNIPMQVILELTYRCNLHCAHCYVDISETDELSLAEWREVLNQLKAAGATYLLFTGGEALLRDDFLDIAIYARRSGFLLGLLSNCTLLTPDSARSIVKLRPFLLGTSIYGATEASHESVTNVRGSFGRTLEGVKLLVAAGLIPLVQVPVMKSNVNELPQIKALLESLGARVSFGTTMVPSKTGADFPFRYEPAIEQLLNCGWHPDIRDQAGDAGLQLCKAGKAICSVSPRGDVFPCILFPMRLGNLRELSFDSIWRLEPCAELRYLRSMRRSDLFACNMCKLNAYCDRCTGSAYLESGRMDGPSSSACRQAHVRWRLSQAAEVDYAKRALPETRS